MRAPIERGSIVVCINDENVEGYVYRDRVYTVDETLHQGEFLRIKGVTRALAASRFKLVGRSGPSSMEYANASNQ